MIKFSKIFKDSCIHLLQLRMHASYNSDEHTKYTYMLQILGGGGEAFILEFQTAYFYYRMFVADFK